MTLILIRSLSNWVLSKTALNSLLSSNIASKVKDFCQYQIVLYHRDCLSLPWGYIHVESIQIYSRIMCQVNVLKTTGPLVLKPI